MCTIFFGGGEDQEVCKRMILKCILKNRMEGCGPDSLVSAHGPMACSCAHGNEQLKNKRPT